MSGHRARRAPPAAVLSTLLLAGPAFAQSGAQDVRPEARAGELDPFLWEAIREDVKRADQAERDPKRGPENAKQILEQAKRLHGSVRLRTALDLRIAATSLRDDFAKSRRFPEPVRQAQVLSTFSRLDLFEPGLPAALEAALAARKAHAEAEGEKVDLPKKPKVDVAVLTRTRAVDGEAFARRLKKALGKVGLTMNVVPPASADFVLEVDAKDGPSPDGRRALTTSIELEQVEGGKVVWRTAAYRTSAAPTAEAALDAGLEWLSRIGGRDLLFRYLAEGPLPELQALAPDHDGHAH